MALLDYRAPRLAANTISTHFHGNRHAAVVLDVACGTGMVSKEVHSQIRKIEIKHSGDSCFRNFEDQFQTFLYKSTFLFLAVQYKSICLAISQPHICLLNR